MPKGQVQDTFIYREEDTLLSRSAWIDGLGLAVKSATIFPKKLNAFDTKSKWCSKFVFLTKLES